MRLPFHRAELELLQAAEIANVRHHVHQIHDHLHSRHSSSHINRDIERSQISSPPR